MDNRMQALDTPVELSAELLEQVSGGSPRGTWIEESSASSQTTSEETSSPRGTWES
jgi:hypothetical protein